MFDIVIDGSGYKWICFGSSSVGFFFFDEGDMEDFNDDWCCVFIVNNSELFSNDVNCVIVDIDGDIWVGMIEGVVIFECGSSVFDEFCIGIRCIVE